MSVTVYNPDGYEISGNSQLVVLPAAAKLAAITVAEWKAGTAIECSTKAFGVSTDVSTTETKYLCDKVAKKRPGTRSYTMEPLTIKVGNPQSDAENILSKFPIDGTVFLAHRPGVPHTTAPTAGQKYEAVKAIVSSVDMAPIGVEEGGVYEIVVNLAILDRTQLLGAIKA